MDSRMNKSTQLIATLDLSRSVVMYATAGAFGTGAHFAVLMLLAPLTGPLVATTIGAACGALTNYALARRFVFESKARNAQTMPRFMLVALLGLAINGAVMASLIGVLPLLASQAGASAVVLLVGYAVNRYWTFR